MEKEKSTNGSKSLDFQSVVLSVLAIVAVLIMTVYLVITSGPKSCAGSNDKKPVDKLGPVDDGNHTYPYNTGSLPALLEFPEDATVIPAPEIKSEYAAIADSYSGKIVASRQATKQVYPASITKVMTMIVVVENIKEESNLDDRIEITETVVNEMIAEGSSGLIVSKNCIGDSFTVRDLLYIMMLDSDGVASTELAIYTAGTVDRFVDMMNEKAEAMGLTGTHFTNCTGLFNENHYSTCRDLASIMVYAVKNDLCRTLMSTKEYNAVIPYHDDATGTDKNITYYAKHSLIYTQMKKYSPSQPANVQVVGGKTGYVGKESGYCLATFAYDEVNRKYYVCVTVNADTYADCIADYVSIYQNYVPAETAE